MRHSRQFKSIVAAIMAIVAVLAGQSAWADGWSVDFIESTHTFVITRTNTASKEMVKYHTVSGSALGDTHFKRKSYTLTFNVGESTQEVVVEEYSFADVPLQFRYSGNNKFYYDFVVTDQTGTVLASKRRTWQSGGTSNNEYYLSDYNNWVNAGCQALTYFDNNSVSPVNSVKHWDANFTPTEGVHSNGDAFDGYVLIDDSDNYNNYPATVTPNSLFVANRAGGSGEWHKLIGNKLYASVVFTEKEKDDGYGYVQILIGDSNTAYDEGPDPFATVNNPVNSIYKACFELKKGSGAYSGYGMWIFPHTSDANMGNGEDFWLTGVNNNYSYLWKQKFRSESFRGDSTYIINAFVLDPDISALTVRFDCGGDGNDTYGYKDLFVRWALVDKTAPTVLKTAIAISRGLHVKGNRFAISVPFSEPVTMNREIDYILHTSWGAMRPEIENFEYLCNGANVITFYGTITADAGTVLTINSLELKGVSAQPEIRDLVGNPFDGNVSTNFDLTVDDSYTISYNLNGGNVAYANPTKYSNESDAIILINPTREHFVFAGWTGTGLSTPTKIVTIPHGSTGDRSYTATWTPKFDWSGDGSQGNPYIITTAEELDMLAIFVNEGYTFSDTYFELGADIDMSTISPFRSIGNGSDETTFCGYFDGKRYCISNVLVEEDISLPNSGLFREIKNGYVKNVVMSNATIRGKRYVGAIVGSCKQAVVSGCVAKNCTITGSKTIYDDKNLSVGAVVGYLYLGNVSDCIADGCSVSGNSKTNLYIGSVVGFCDVSNSATHRVDRNVASGCSVNGTSSNSNGAYIGSLIGHLSSTTSSDGFAINTTTNGTNVLFGRTSGSTSVTNNHYRSVKCKDSDPVSDVYVVNASPNFTISGTKFISYAGIDYYCEDAAITVSSSPSSTISNVYYTPEGGSSTLATDNGNGTWSFTMPANDVTVGIEGSLDLTTHEATVMGDTRYVSSFYDGTTDYQLPEGALAYTAGLVNGTAVFYRIGEDSNLIPHGTAVIIVADASALTGGKLTLTTADAGGITARAGNILRGSDTSIAKPDGNVYVLGVNGSGVMDFVKFTGSTIPAGRAYYVAE